MEIKKTAFIRNIPLNIFTWDILIYILLIFLIIPFTFFLKMVHIYKCIDKKIDEEKFKQRELGEMIMVSSTLTGGQRFDSCFGYGATLKLIINIHSFNELIECIRLINGLVLIDTLRNKKKIHDGLGVN